MGLLAIFRKRPNPPPRLVKSLIWEDYVKWAASVHCTGCGVTKADDPTLMWVTEELCFPCWVAGCKPAPSEEYQHFRRTLGR